MKELQTEIEVAASPERIWDILTDFGSFPQWNPFILTVDGELTAGTRLEVRIQPPGGMAMTFKPTVITVEPNLELRWLGHLMTPGLFDGEHYFLIEDAGEGRSRLVQGEKFSGALVSLMGLIGLYGKTVAGFQEMNQALKARAEQRP